MITLYTGVRAMNDKFEELNTLFTAIKDIDRICSNEDKTDILEDILFAVKEIDKSEYGPEYVEVIVNSIRSALLQIYSSKLSEVNGAINLETRLDSRKIV